ncbi:MAG: MBL fold metallo-hydrolase [Campylobacter sp.]|nr:MBL fold metallo-hydrolase [Campylobacter sp.]
MQIIKKSFGECVTNCYIISSDKNSLIIDPGDGAFEWVIENAKSPLAILLTHGHFDHIYDCASLKNSLNLPVYIHKNDAFMCKNDVFAMGYECFSPDFCVDEGEVKIGEFEFSFMHFPGHTPGSCMIKINDIFFSGDFLFKDSVGRWDFEFSNAEDMLKSLEKAMLIKQNFILYPGHGWQSDLYTEMPNIKAYINYIRNSLR